MLDIDYNEFNDWFKRASRCNSTAEDFLRDILRIKEGAFLTNIEEINLNDKLDNDPNGDNLTVLLSNTLNKIKSLDGDPTEDIKQDMNNYDYRYRLEFDNNAITYYSNWDPDRLMRKLAIHHFIKFYDYNGTLKYINSDNINTIVPY